MKIFLELERDYDDFPNAEEAHDTLWPMATRFFEIQSQIEILKAPLNALDVWELEGVQMLKEEQHKRQLADMERQRQKAKTAGRR